MATLDATNDTAPVRERPRSRRGFAGMDPAIVRDLASKGGKAAHEKGRAHEFTPEEARVAGHKGGIAPHSPRTRRATKE
jgi:general stress protein YciG